MKKLLAILLCLVMVVSLAMPAVYADEGNTVNDNTNETTNPAETQGDPEVNVASIQFSAEDTRCYTTFADAVTAAGNDYTITLLDDITEAYEMNASQTLKVALAGHTVTVNAPAGYCLTTTLTEGVTTTYILVAAKASVTNDEGTTYYKTFAEAVTAANGTDVVTLLADVEGTYTIGASGSAEKLKVAKNTYALTVGGPGTYEPACLTDSDTEGVTTYTWKAEASITSGETTCYYATLASAVTAAENNATIVLVADVTLTSRLSVNKSITITNDENDRTIYVVNTTSSDGSGRGIQVGNNSTLTIKKSTEGSLTLCGTKDNANYNYGPMLCVWNGTLLTENVTICNAQGSSHGGGIYVNSTGVAYLNNGTVVQACSVNDGYNGGGIYVVASGILNMSSGAKITGCSAPNGGGVYSLGIFNMSGGEISSCEATNNGGGICSKGTLTISGGKITNNSATSNGGGVRVESGTANISGGYFYSNTSSNNYSFLKQISKPTSLSINLTGGWFPKAVRDGYPATEYYATGECADAPNSNAKYTVSQGYTVNYIVKIGTDTDLNLPSATVNNASEEKTVTLLSYTVEEGSAFSGWYLKETCEGTKLAVNTQKEFSKDTTLYGKVTEYCVSVNSQNYTSLSTAAAAAKADDIIKLLKDITISDTVTMKAGTLDFNGKTITNTGSARAIDIEGTVTVTDNSTGVPGGIIDNSTMGSSNNGSAFYVTAGSSLTIENGLFTKGTGSQSQAKNIVYAVQSKNADNPTTVTITGGVFDGIVGKGDKNTTIKISGGFFGEKMAAAFLDTGYKYLEVIAGSTGNRFYDYAPWTVTNTSCTLTYNANFGTGSGNSGEMEVDPITVYYLTGYTNTTVATGKTPIKYGDGTVGYKFKCWCTGPEETADTTSYDIGESISISEDMTLYAIYESSTEFVAEIDGVGRYVTLAEAILMAGETPSTISLIDDVCEIVRVIAKQDITINLGEYDITGYGTSSAITNKGTLTVNGAGEIKGQAQTKGGAVDNYGTLVINGGTISGTISDTNAASGMGGAIYNRSVTNDRNPTVIINGGSISGTAKIGGGIYNEGILTIKGGSVTGSFPTGVDDCEGKAIYNNGTTNISGGTVSEDIYNVDGKTISISGGKFDVFNPTEYITESCVVEGTGPWSVYKVTFTKTNYLNLSDDLQFIFNINKPDGLNGKVTANFSMVGVDNGPSATGVEPTGTQVAFDGISPQYIGTEVKAELYVDDVLVDVFERSIQGYLVALYGQNTTDETTKTLIRDVVDYGIAANAYATAKNYSKGTTITRTEGWPEATATLPETANKQTNASADLKFTATNVLFKSKNSMYVKFIMPETGSLYVNDNLVSENDLTKGSKENEYIYYINDIKTSEILNAYTFKLVNGNVENTLANYSIGSYTANITSSESTASEAMKTLALATYRLGTSAKAYVDAAA